MTTHIHTDRRDEIKPYLSHLVLPQPDSHKGQNGKVLIVGGSKLFHSASIWAAEVASHFTDMVHYVSTKENEEIFLSLKKKFHNGIIVPRKDMLGYIHEDDAVLIGPGMVRGEISEKLKVKSEKFEEIVILEKEEEYTYYLTEYLLHHFPEKKFVLDAGALQMMKPEWLLAMKTKPIVTPHQIEFEKLFGIRIKDRAIEEKIRTAEDAALKYNCIILLKAISDIVTDGKRTVLIEGGNQGLTKGGTGDVLAGLTVSFLAKTPAFESAIVASYVLKRSADEISSEKKYWYNVDDIIRQTPITLAQLL